MLVFDDAVTSMDIHQQLIINQRIPPSSSILIQPCWVIRQGSPQEALIAPMFVEDPLPTSGSPGFLEYMQVLQRDVLSK